MAVSSSSSSSNSPSSSAVASWYCWYSDTKSFMLDSASVNSISSIPSPVYQCKKALRLNIAVNCSRVSNEGGSHFQTSGWNIANSSLDVVGDPFNKVRAVLVLDVQHLFVNLLHGHAASENGSHSQVPTVTGIASGHHVFGVKHLLGQFWDSQRPVLLATS